MTSPQSSLAMSHYSSDPPSVSTTTSSGSSHSYQSAYNITAPRMYHSPQYAQPLPMPNVANYAAYAYTNSPSVHVPYYHYYHQHAQQFYDHHMVNKHHHGHMHIDINTASEAAQPALPQARNLAIKGSGTEIVQFGVENSGKLQLKDCVFMSKDCTSRLAKYIVKEYWGREYSLLFKYLDYIFRCQTFSKQTKKIVHFEHGRSHKATEFLVFHTGLQRRSDSKLLYAVLIPNTVSGAKKKNAPWWRVQFGGIHNSFMSKQELLRRLKEEHGVNVKQMEESALPQRTDFCLPLVYNAMYAVSVNWEERLITNQDRVHKVMGNAAVCNMKQLVAAFDAALRETQLMAQINARVAVPQVFVDSKHGTFRMELLLPLSVRFGGKHHQFALALRKCDKTRKYVVKSILTLQMAYANARLCGYVDSLWLTHCTRHNNNESAHDQDLHHFCIHPSF
eukprot:CAMPEP_0197033316 /NCGR_PEP_ID=MMETSP1384-20130603/11758_1 /TAXON_ID=29189 /ORGANISM="Ammonia sp." /LENGTH=448 /DNA_ID=CAMNT_0042463107 /DNA_START=41 /DNA_END=1387 /DNA_ORIENTATION=-